MSPFRFQYVLIAELWRTMANLIVINRIPFLNSRNGIFFYFVPTLFFQQSSSEQISIYKFIVY